MKTLILTEKREAGYQAAATLGDSILGSNEKKLADVSKSNGYLEGEKYILCWASGHLFRELKPSEIDEQYQLWQKFASKEDYKMPNLINQIKTIAAKEQNKQRQIKILKEILNRSDIEEIIVMTDADEEGEAIGRDMLYKIVNKLSTSNITRAFNSGSFKAVEAVTKALKERENIDSEKYNRLYDAQQVRSKGDYLVGMKLTKALCDTYNQKLYTGRVKGVLIALIGDREKEIKEFQTKEFYTLTGKKDNVDLKHFFYEEIDDEEKPGEVKKYKQERYFESSEIDAIIEKINKADKKGSVIEYTQETTSSKSRPLPLSGTDFADEMMTQYKITYKQCNEILDYLRQEGFTTYPGTNGRYFAHVDAEIVQDSYAAAKKYFGVNAEYSTEVPIFNDKKAEKQNHHPLALTGKVPTQSDVENWSKHNLSKIKEGYELIASRILIHFMENDNIQKQALVIDINGALFYTSGQKAINQGWRTLIQKEIKNTLFEFSLKEGDEIQLDAFEKKIGSTQCPSLYTEATLTKIMLNISKVVDDMIKEETDPQKLEQLKKDRKLLKDAEGIGTDRTREQIISDLVKAELITQTPKGLILSASGNIQYEVLPPKLKDPILTATWERYFDEIRQGKLRANEILKDIDETVMNEMVTSIVDNPIQNFILQSGNKKLEEDVKCPLCGGELIETAKTYKCENNEYKNGQQSGCKFSIFKDQTKFFGRVITSKDLPAIFAATEAEPYKDQKNGIYINTDNKYFLETVFEQQQAKPGELIETAKTFKKDDKFVFKSVRFKNLTKVEAEKLLDGQQISLTRKSKAGKSYKILAKLSSDNNGQVDIKKVNK